MRTAEMSKIYDTRFIIPGTRNASRDMPFCIAPDDLCLAQPPDVPRHIFFVCRTVKTVHERRGERETPVETLNLKWSSKISLTQMAGGMVVAGCVNLKIW